MTNFKIGDWAVCPEDNKIFLIDGDYNGGYQSTEYWSGLDFILWQPQPGEWCWFWNDNNYLPNLRQFSSCLKTIDGTTIHLIKQDKSTGILMSHCGIEGYTHCEPFIGQLPTSLKDNT